MQVFIDSKYRLAYNGRYTTDEEITGMLIAVLFAGQHTSSVTSTWTLLSMLANKVSCQSQASALGYNNNNPTPRRCFS